MKNPAAETAGYQNQENLSRVLSFLRKQESRGKNWIPHQVRNDRNKVTLWQDHRELQVKFFIFPTTPQLLLLQFRILKYRGNGIKMDMRRN